MDEFLRWTKRQPSNELDVTCAVDIEADRRIMGARTEVVAVDATNISVVLDEEAAAIEAVVAEEAEEEGPRLKERKKKKTQKWHDRHTQQAFSRFPLVCLLTREDVANANSFPE